MKDVLLFRLTGRGEDGSDVKARIRTYYAGW